MPPSDQGRGRAAAWARGQAGARRTGTARGLRRIATRVSGTRARPRVAAAPGKGETTTDARPALRADPVLRWRDPHRPPAGDFAACAVPNGALTVSHVPVRGDSWEAVSSFSLSYDGYGYWDDVSELAARCLRRWTRDRGVPDTVDELRGCLFYEQRRWHHFGEDPNGRAAQYVWVLLDALRERVAQDRSLLEPAVDPGSFVRRTPPMRDEASASCAIRSFLGDDEGYQAWATEHRDGFVVNADRTMSAASLTLHRANCPSIGGALGLGRRRTASHRKLCATDVDALVAWCRDDVGADPRCCRLCRPLP